MRQTHSSHHEMSMGQDTVYDPALKWEYDYIWDCLV